LKIIFGKPLHWPTLAVSHQHVYVHNPNSAAEYWQVFGVVSPDLDLVRSCSQLPCAKKNADTKKEKSAGHALASRGTASEGAP
jgi:hypothetical protein